MKMIITEKQLSRILSENSEIDEAESLTSPSTTNTSASSTSSGDSFPSSPSAEDMEPYPAGTTKWEDIRDPISRGVANPVGRVKKREEYDGAEPKRGVANQLR